MRKIVALLAVYAMAASAIVASLAGCVDPAPAPAAPSGGIRLTAPPTSNMTGGSSGGASSGSAATYSAKMPALVTSSGQSADFQMIGTVMGKLGLDYTVNNLATSANLGSAKTLIVVVGGSSKGLGAAGIDADGELARVVELINGAKSKGLSVIAMHTGGAARRGDLSDKFIAPVFEKADYAIVVSAGDEDGLMAGICKSKGITMDAIKSIREVSTILPAVFGGAGSSGSTGSGGGSVAISASTPCLLTSSGQSADYQMIGTVMGKLGLDYTVNNLATSANLGSAKTLIVVVGGSSKGLGAAGIDADGELARVVELIDGAKSKGLSVIAMHTGGAARRGDLSDKFIAPVFEKADYAIVVSAGDEDGLMAGICKSKGITMNAIKSIREVSTILPAVFGGGGSSGTESRSAATYSAKGPALLTSSGQSADFQMIGTIMGKSGLDYTVNNLATSANLGNAKTLIVVVGGSSKGLGAAGIDADGELARVTELIDGAKSKGLSVIAMHTGGAARRGDLSDKFIAPVFEKADYAIVVSAGDEDGLMAGICKGKNIPMDAIKSIREVATILPAVFQ